VKCNGWLKRFALADDHEDPNNESVMSYWQALDRAKSLARAGEGNDDTPISVKAAIDAYEVDLQMGGRGVYNARLLRLHVSEALMSKAVALLSERDLRNLRANLIKKGLKASTVNRIGRSLKAALTLAAGNDDRIVNGKAWKQGLKKLPEGETARNVILSDVEVSKVVRGCYAEGHEFGVLIETLAETGARESQVLRLTVGDLQDDPVAPRLMMPSSRKGRNRKVEYRPLPISPRLAKLLRQQAKGRGLSDLLFNKIWGLSVPFRTVAKREGLSDAATPYSLRHSSIVRQLLKHVPTRVVAAHHDTSVVMLEQHYSRFILNPNDALTRATLLNFDTAPSEANVIPITR
jgi:integrase